MKRTAAAALLLAGLALAGSAAGQEEEQERQNHDKISIKTFYSVLRVIVLCVIVSKCTAPHCTLTQ